MYTYCEGDSVNGVDPSGHETVELSGYYGEEYFVPIWDGKTLYYGGDQAWYSDEWKQYRGCAPVAVANVLAYLAINHYKYRKLYKYGRYYNSKFSHSFLKKSEFVKHMDETWNYVTPGVAGFWEMPFFVRGIIDMAKDRGVTITAHYASTKYNWRTYVATFDKVVQYVKNGLKKNSPVVLMMWFNDSIPEFQNHWMTITKIDDNRSSDGSGFVSVRISTWSSSTNRPVQWIINDFSKIMDAAKWSLMYFT